ncbi:MAG: RNA methyltransferase [Pseudomonadota bacterium]
MVDALSTAVRFVLVEPDHPGNIGGACRALKNMGYGSLELINPKRFPDPQAEWRAAGAQDVLDAVRVHERLEDVIDDCEWVVGTSARSRNIPWPLVTPRTLGARLAEKPPSGPVAILFGRETNGLYNEELQRCQLHLAIPGNPAYPSLNLAMAVQVVAYELHLAGVGLGERAAGDAIDWAGNDRPFASSGEVDRVVRHLERMATGSGFVDPESPGQTLTRFRRLLLKAELDRTEVAMLHGLFKQVGYPLDGSEELNSAISTGSTGASE